MPQPCPVLPCPPQDVMDMDDAKPSAPRPRWYQRCVPPCVAELLGTALFVFLGCLSVLEDSGGTGRLQPALAHGLALGVAVAVLGDIR
uniref:AQP8 protein n=1 Tax=Taeniopygia guttata TaxID=59729 RepID=H0Z758_TAEGU